ncbi:Ran GTPase-activating protein 1 [Hypsizygus marmoreus]|uniref:Ran GTPase-activating protein 1 n=1 Tax=Hypsizygus marmoreus TaxID=39966 RepID=A0A369JYX0_HYPMA|nr:Ran GTPase-activating protein 1 [Hypsizygus marmoreus]
MASTSRLFSLKDKALSLDSKEDIEALLSGVDLAAVEEVDLSGNTIGVGAAEALGDAFRKMSSLKIANLSNIFTRRLDTEIPFALIAICDALKDATNLIELDLSSNAFGDRFVGPLVPLLSQNQSIQILRLMNNGIGAAGGRIIAGALLESARMSKAAGKPSNLRVVICSRNRLEDGSASIWAEAFAAHGNLLEVRMANCGIRQEGLTSIIRGLATSVQLRHLDLADNVGRDVEEATEEHGWTALADTIAAWRELETLNLSDCDLNEAGLTPILERLGNGIFVKLHTLQLVNNGIEDSQYEALFDLATSHLPALKRLELWWNDIDSDDPSIQAIARVLKNRGGRLFLIDPDEEEAEEEEIEHVEEKAEEEEEREEEKEEEETDLSTQMAHLGVSSP